jgi:hypothetical protein
LEENASKSLSLACSRVDFDEETARRPKDRTAVVEKADDRVKRVVKRYMAKDNVSRSIMLMLMLYLLYKHKGCSTTYV